MNLFDVIILVVVSFCLVRGLFRGFIREVSSIVGVLAGFYGAGTYYPLVAPFLNQWVDNPGYRKIISFFVLFCGILIAVNLVAALIRYLLNIVFLGWVDRLCGLVFGAAKGLLIVSILLIVVTILLPRNTAFVSESRLCPHVVMVSEVLSVFVPQEMQHQLHLKIEGIKKSWEKQKMTTSKRV
ncbi:putative colicin V production protein-like protein [Desulforapulum autotrophicum HRM2]|uniref:Colicin V production protein-like protein n=1 Tax=Desulforapulum autotrophicum (strain ATCC 43914 / DSM 3382 / VKM B-1955 / HRM2) TaxID=177437 RepID=C0Q9D6_DESAH|nr:CvpA family protein [Desulforapulum autotrophicum]ACN16641.1 putative colicin V production protein-like protein [Desulforapulum autotrophicum HRM2]